MSFRVNKNRNGFQKYPSTSVTQASDDAKAQVLSDYTSSLFLDEKYSMFDFESKDSAKVSAPPPVPRQRSGGGMRMRQCSIRSNEDRI